MTGTAIAAAPALGSLAYFCHPGVVTWRRPTSRLARSGPTQMMEGSWWAFLARQGMLTADRTITGEHVEAFIAAELERTNPASAATRYRSLQQLFRWLGRPGPGGKRRRHSAAHASRPAEHHVRGRDMDGYLAPIEWRFRRCGAGPQMDPSADPADQASANVSRRTGWPGGCRSW